MRVFLTLLIVAGPALARGLTLEELPTVKELQRLAEAEIKRLEQEAAEARRDPKRERIEAYRSGATSMFDWKEVVEILKDDKEEATYRLAAANAIRERFKDLDRGSPQIAGLMKRIGIDLIKKLNDNKDVRVRTWVHNVYKTFWPGKAQVFNFKPDDPNYRARFKAWKEWRDFLFE